MWIQKILVLLLLQRVLSHTLSRYGPQDTEVYELKQDKDTNTVQFIYPKSSVPKLREIVYYHIIEKPYETPAEVITEGELAESETERSPTNRHGLLLENMLLDYDSDVVSSTNPPEEFQSYSNEPDEPTSSDDAQYYVPAEATEPEENFETTEIAEPEETGESEVVQEEPNSDQDEVSEIQEEPNGDEDEVTEIQEEPNNDYETFEYDTRPIGADEDSYFTEGDETKDETVDIPVETTEPMTEEFTETAEDEISFGKEISLKRLEAMNQLYRNPEEMRMRYSKIRSYLPHLHPTNAQQNGPVVMASQYPRLRRSVTEKKNSRRRREILTIFPQGKSLPQPYDEYEIPQAPTLSPMDTEGLPDFIKHELNPGDDAKLDSETETPEVFTEETTFVPPSDTYGVKLDNGNGYVWNTLYGSVRSEPAVTKEEESTTIYPLYNVEETTVVPLYEEFTTISAYEEIPEAGLYEQDTSLTTEEPTYGEIPEESLNEGEPDFAPEEPTYEELPEESLNEHVPEFTTEGAYYEEIPEENVKEEPAFTTEIPSEIPEETFPGEDNSEGLYTDLENIHRELGEIPSEDIVELTGDDDEEMTITGLLPIVIKKYDVLNDLTDLEKQGESVPKYIKEIEKRIKNYLKAAKVMLADQLEKNEEEQQEELFGDHNNDDDITPLTTASDGDPITPEEHGTYGFHLHGDQGVVWNDFTGVRYHVGNGDPNFENFEKIEPDFNNLNKPVASTETLLEPFDKITDDNTGIAKFDNTAEDKINVATNGSHITKKPFELWVQEWAVVFKKYIDQYINKTIVELLNEEAAPQDTRQARLFVDDKELSSSSQVDTIINTISDKYLRRRRKHKQRKNCKELKPTIVETSDSTESPNTVNIFVFLTEEKGDQILDLLKPETIEEFTESEYIDTSDEDYKPDESETEDYNEEDIDPSFVITEPSFITPVDEVTEQSTDDRIWQPLVDEEPEVPAEDVEHEETTVIDIVEEPVTEEEIIEIVPAEEETNGVIEENTSIENEPTEFEEIVDKELVITELPAANLEEEDRGDLDSEVVEGDLENEEPTNQEYGELIEDAEVPEPTEEEEGGDIVAEEPLEDEPFDDVIEPLEEEEVGTIEGEDSLEQEPLEEEPINDVTKTIKGEEVPEEEHLEEETIEREEVPEPLEEEPIDDVIELAEGEEVAEPIEEEDVVEEEPSEEEPLEEVPLEEEPLEEEPLEEEPLEEKPLEEEPLEEVPLKEEPIEEVPLEEEPLEEVPLEKEPFAEEPLEEESLEEKPLEEEPLEEEPLEDNPLEEEPLEEEPLEEEPLEEELLAEKSLEKEPLEEKPLEEEPLEEEPLEEEPLEKEPLEEKPLEGELLEGKPLQEEPLEKEPLDEEPLEEEPLEEEPLEPVEEVVQQIESDDEVEEEPLDGEEEVADEALEKDSIEDAEALEEV